MSNQFSVEERGRSAFLAAQRLKARWSDPAEREKMLARLKAMNEARCGKPRPHPPGWSEKVKAAWDRRKADGTAKYPCHNKPHSPEARKKMSESRKGKYRGAASPHWRGGITPVCQLVRASMDYANWRTEVFKRDGYKCVTCGARGSIHADHHPKTFADIIRSNKIASLDDAVACSELWDTTNGRTLCEDCHRKTETWAWRGRSKKKQ